MQNVTELRLRGAVSLLAIIGGGLATNCELCPDPDPTAPPDPKVPAIGDTAPVQGCGDVLRFRAYAGLRAEQCDGTDSSGNPDVFAVGQELDVLPPVIRKCPDPGPYRVGTPFQVYWTLCNRADRVPLTLVNYDFRVFTRSNGVETLSDTFTLTQPSLQPCECVDVAIAFNNGDPARSLGAGDYIFRLSDIYENASFEQAVVTP